MLGIRPGQHKTAHHDKTRTVFIGARAQEIILPDYEGWRGDRLFPMTRAALRRAIARGCTEPFLIRSFPRSARRRGTTSRKSSYRRGGKHISGTPIRFGTPSEPKSEQSMGSRPRRSCLAIAELTSRKPTQNAT